jgi:hypothetical protein
VSSSSSSSSTCGSTAAKSSWPVIGAPGAACSGTGLSDGFSDAPKADVRVLNGASRGDSHEIHCTNTKQVCMQDIQDSKQRLMNRAAQPQQYGHVAIDG